MTLISRVASACALLFLTACGILPTYAPTAEEKTIEIRFISFVKPSICFEDKTYKINLTENNGKYFARIPANKRVTFSNEQSFHGYQVISYCTASLSLTTESDKKIVLNAGTYGDKCYIEAVLEDSSTPTGVKIDPSLSPPHC